MKRENLIDFLVGIKDFASLTRQQLLRIASAKKVVWGPEQFILTEGSNMMDELPVILEGTVFIHKIVGRKGKVVEYERVAEIKAPAIIGENSFFTGLPRSAGVYAHDQVFGLSLHRAEVNGLIALDKVAYYKFLRSIANENILRVERTLAHFTGSLKIIIEDVDNSKNYFHVILARLKRNIDQFSGDPQVLEDHIKDIFMLAREVNNAFEDLYRFAILPEVYVKKVNPERFSVHRLSKFYEIMVKIVSDLYQTQQLVSIQGVNLKSAVLSSVMEVNSKVVNVVDYHSMIWQASEVYETISEDPGLLGMQLDIQENRKSVLRNISIPATGIKSLIWD